MEGSTRLFTGSPSTAKVPKTALALAAFLSIALPLVLNAQPLPSSEKQKIELLIKRVAGLKDVKFVRNGSTYNPDTAATFLRSKWQANESHVKTARDFIEKVASFSETSGKDYLIRFKDGSEVKSRDYLLGDLQRIEKSLIELDATRNDNRTETSPAISP
jgi:Family of unknown function (DUF5329)